MGELASWVQQPFYTVLPDLRGQEVERAVETGEPGATPGTWRWRWPEELAAWDVNHFDRVPAPLYLPEDALRHDPNDEATISHPELDDLFLGYDSSPHRGRTYRPAPRLRLWQQQRAKVQQEARRAARTFSASPKNPYDAMKGY